MPDLPRRALLRSAAISTVTASSMTSSAPLVPDAVAAGTAISIYPTRRALAAAPGARPGELAYLDEGARAGLFRCVSGRLRDRDPLQGLYVAAESGEVHYARVWDGACGRPEWFGARADDGDFDCADAIEACYALCPVTQFAQSDYFIRRTLRFNTSWRTVRGTGALAHEQGQGTRIVLHRAASGSHTADIVLVGSEQPPSGGALSFLQENHFSAFTLMRDAAATPHSSGDVAHYPTGLRISYVIRCTFSGISAMESSVGFFVGGAVYTKIDDCTAQRLQAGTDAHGDYMVGFLLDGHRAYGMAGGNASLYMNRCIVTGTNPRQMNPVGLLARGAFVDTFLDYFETAQVATGIAFAVEGARGAGQTIDLHIRYPVLDVCSRYGLDIDLDSTSAASIEIIDPYITAGFEGGDRGILIHDGAGLVTITGGQVHGDFNGGSLWFSRTRGIRVQGAKIQNSIRPVVITEASGLHLEPQIKNVGKTSSSFAITCGALTRSIVRPVVIGTNGPSFAGGISLGAGTNHCEIDGSAIDPGCFTVATAANKVRFDGGDARLGTSGATFTAAGNVLVGVTS